MSSSSSAASANADLHEEFVRSFHENGLSALAAEVGIMVDGRIPNVLEHQNTAAGGGRGGLGMPGKRKADDGAGAHAAAMSMDVLGGAASQMGGAGGGAGGLGGGGGGGGGADLSSLSHLQGAANMIANSDLEPSIIGETSLGKKPKKKRVQRSHPGGKANKGLRHFSLKVCQKVEEKDVTTYNEVADELVKEFAASVLTNPVDQAYDEKNIRRRVYDALNVLMAMNIITKEKKQISWKGLPSNYERELANFEKQVETRRLSIARKRQHLREILQQQVALRHLIERNRQQQAASNGAAGGGGAAAAADDADRKHQIQLPFIIVSAPSDTVIQCEMSEDRYVSQWTCFSVATSLSGHVCFRSIYYDFSSSTFKGVHHRCASTVCMRMCVSVRDFDKVREF